MSEPVLRVESISRSVDGRVLWSDLSFELTEGQCLVLKGPSGSGKTLLLRTLVGLERLESGRIMLFGESPDSVGIPRMRARMMLVPQSASLTGTVVEDVLRAPFELDVHADRLWSTDEAERLGDRFGRDETFLSAELGDLSGGERQITALMRALLLQPEVLLLDEPTAHLDFGHALDAFEIVAEIQRSQSVTVVSVTHSINMASRFSDRVAMLARGRVVADGSPDRVLTPAVLSEVFDHPVAVESLEGLGSVAVPVGGASRADDGNLPTGTAR